MLFPTGFSTERERDQGLTAWLSASPCRVSTPFTWSVLQHMGVRAEPAAHQSHHQAFPLGPCGSVTGCSNPGVLTPRSPSQGFPSSQRLPTAAQNEVLLPGRPLHA